MTLNKKRFKYQSYGYSSSYTQFVRKKVVPVGSAPIITSLDVTIGPSLGTPSTTIVISRVAGIADIDQVYFDGNSASITTQTTSTITVTIPAHAAGSVNVYVHSAGGGNSNTLSSAFTYYDAPTFTACAPPIGDITGSVAVTINGTGFTSPNFNTPKLGASSGSLFTNVSIINDTTLTALTPSRAVTTSGEDIYASSAGGPSVSGNALYTSWDPVAAGAYCCVRTDKPNLVVLGSTLHATGTTPPAITLSGSANNTYQLQTQCTQAGARGIWQGWWSLDGGITQTNFTSAASVLMSGSGLSMLIPVGSGSVDNAWYGVCSQLTDQSANNTNFTQVVAVRQPRIIRANSADVPYLKFGEYASSQFACSSIPGVTTQPHTIGVVAWSTDSTASTTWIDGNAANVGGNFGRASATTVKINAGAGKSITSSATTPEAKHAYTLLYNGASSSIRVDGSQLASGDAGPGTPTYLRIGGNYAGTTTPTAFQFLTVFTGSLDTANRASLETYMKAKYGTP